MARQENPVGGRQVAALFQQCITARFQFLHRFSRSGSRILPQQLLFGIVFRRGVLQGVDAAVERFNLFQNIFDHALRFLVCAAEAAA